MLHVCIRDNATHWFLGEENQWLQNRSQAKIFKSGAAAIEYCLEHHVDDYLLVLKFDDAAAEIEIPMSDKRQ